jgi:hypothetical protein
MAIVTSKNTQPTTVGIVVYNLKQFLVGSAAWTVIASGDGLAAYGAASDIITTGAVGAGGFGQVKAWIRIRMPGTTREWIIQAGTAATNLRIKYSALGFLGGAPSAVQPPTAVDEQIVLAGGTDAAPTGTNFVGTLNRVSMWADNASPYGFGIHGWSGAGANTFAWVIEAMQAGTYAPTDVDPYINLIYANSSQFGAWGTTGLATNTVNLGWLAKGLGGAGWVGFAGYGYTDSSGVLGVTTFYAVNPCNAKDDTLPIMFGRNSVQVAPTGYKGIGQYIRSTPTSRANLSTQTVNTALDRIVFGLWTVPWGTDGVAPLL